MRHGYIEVNKDSDTDLWVQWLDDDEVSARQDIEDWDAVLTVQLPGASEIEFNGTLDMEVSAFHFVIPQPQAVTLPADVGSLKVMVFHKVTAEPRRLVLGKVRTFAPEVLV